MSVVREVEIEEPRIVCTASISRRQTNTSIHPSIQKYVIGMFSACKPLEETLSNSIHEMRILNKWYV